MALFACRSSREFAGKVVENMNRLGGDEESYRLEDLEVAAFSDGEFQQIGRAHV